MNRTLRLFVAVSAFALPSLRSVFAADDWPQWRGPDGQGHSTATKLPSTWSETENVAWKTELPGRGWSSPVVAADRLWLTTAVTTPASEAEKAERLKANTGNQPLNVVGKLSMRVVGVDRETGRLRHDVELMSADKPDWVHALNSYASPSPILEGDVLYCHFGTNGTAAFDVKTGKVVWTQRSLKVNHENGPGSSPVLWGDFVIFHGDGSDVQFVAALDKRTGDVAWKTDRTGELRADPQLRKAYGTPLIVEAAGRPVLVSPAADWLYGYDPATGKELWKLSYGTLGFSIVPRPVAGNGLVYFCTSFMQSELHAVRLDAKNPQGIPEVAWRFKKQMPQMPSPLLAGNELYVVSDKGVATCLDATTGNELWTERLGGNFCSSPLLADGKIYFCNREGETTVIAPGRTFRSLGKNKLDAGCMASPAAVGHALYVRTETHLYRLETPRRPAAE